MRAVLRSLIGVVALVVIAAPSLASATSTATVTALGNTKTVKQEKVVEATEATAPPTTTVNCSHSAYCEVTFPAPDDLDLAALGVAVHENVRCPVAERGGCDQYPGHEGLDLVVLNMYTGPSGMNHAQVSFESVNFSLVLTGEKRAGMDWVSCDSNVWGALCGFKEMVPPRTTFLAYLWFDIPTGENWTSVHFRYSNGVRSNVYVFSR